MNRNPKIHDFLRNQPLFSELPADDIDRLAEGTRSLHLEKGALVFRKGDACTGFHIVVYGQVKLAIPSAQGAEKVVEIVGPGYSFGEAVMFMGMPYVVYAQAIVDTMLLHVAKQVVLQEIEADALFARRMLGGMARRLHALLGDVESYSLRSGTQRVIGFLLRGDCPAAPGADAAAGAQAAAGADASAGAHASAQTVTLPATKAMVASRLNLTPEHFSRILHELAAAGLIRVDGREITILDAGSLAAHME